MPKIEVEKAEIVGEPQENLSGRLVAWVKLTLSSGVVIESKGPVRIGEKGQVKIERGSSDDRDVYTGVVTK